VSRGEPPVGFIGLGSMGAPMAANLLAAGFRLRVWNRTPGRAEPLVAQGAVLATDPAGAVEPGGIVVTMLADDRALEEVTLGAGGFLERLGADGVHISMSTVSPALARRLVERHRERGNLYVAAPVFGRPEMAAARKLVICVAGEEPAKARARPLLEVLGQDIFDFGQEAPAAHVVKLAGNFLIASAIEALGEAAALLRKSAVDPAAFMNLMSTTLFACPVYQNYGRIVTEGRYAPAGFRLALGLKDAELVGQAASGSVTPMPFADLVRQRFLAAVAKGRSDLDWAAVALGAAEDAGLPAGAPRKE
jgi:3-hydroxyisobutyrate dehydrogenase-like beta-hydroxyacid dehydrogenase